MHLMKVDPRALKENPDRARQTKFNPQADALMLATIKAVGIVQPAADRVGNRRRQRLHHRCRPPARQAGDFDFDAA